MSKVIPGIVLGAPPEPRLIPTNPTLEWAILFGTRRYSHLVTALNAPGVVVELLASLPTSWPDSWHPARLMLESWRAISMPFFCMPFWWFFGRGVDAALGRRRLHWTSLLAGTLLCGFFLFLLVGLGIAAREWERGEIVDWALCGMALWTIVFGVFPFTWIYRRQTKGTQI
jgi:hypothetical protein